MKKKNLEVLIYRGNSIESRHQVLVQALPKRSLEAETWGSEEQLSLPVFPRSAIKPLQMLLFVESGAWQASGLSERFIALSCSSHQGEPMHLDLIREWMAKLSFTEANLVCAGHWPAHIPSQHAMIRRNETPTAIVNNCSGKHLGILSICKHLGYPLENYGNWAHPFQGYLRRHLSKICEWDLESAPWGIDGCGIPTFAMPLGNLAVGMRTLLDRKENSGAKMIVDAIFKNPLLVGGSEDFTSRVISQSKGKALVKTGAEGVFAGLIFDGEISFALKALDGNSRASEAATAWLLKRWGVFNQDEMLKLRDFEVKNWAGKTVGKIEVQECM